MSSVFFTADTHFGHANIIRFCKRPWYNPKTDVERVKLERTVDGVGVVEEIERWVSPEIAEKRKREMDAALIYNWNAVVKPGDIVWHLGDYCMGYNEADFMSYFRQLNGSVILIKGNHDRLAWKFRDMFYGHYNSYVETKINERAFTLCHYALRVWNKSHHGAWHLYGHSHGSLPDNPNSYSLDVGVDCHNYAPISFERVAALMAGNTFKPIDHHGQL